MQKNSIHHWYGPTQFYVGQRCVAELASAARDAGMKHVLLVTSNSVAADSEIIDPVLAGLGEIDVTIFDQVTIQKRLATVNRGVSIIESEEIDGIVSLGGGSTADAARAMSAVSMTDADPETLFASVSEDGNIEFSDLSPKTLPVIAIPTTLSGAEVTCAAGMNIGDPDTGSRKVRSAPMIGPELWPAAVFYDPVLAAQTPFDILAPSAMNGLDHGIEMVYSRNATPFTDATAAHGVRLLSESLPAIGADGQDLAALERAMMGVALATTGLIDPNSGAKYSLIHAFGHQLAQGFDVQQGRAHGIVAPAVLNFIFDHIEFNQTLLANSLGGSPDGDAQEEIVRRTAEIRDSLGLPAKLRTVNGINQDDLPGLATAIQGDIGLQFGPPELDPSESDLVRVLESSW